MLPIYHLLPPRLREKIVKEILVSLGIGSGSGVETSGERAVLELLNKKSQSLCIFDVGANVGKYLQLCTSVFTPPPPQLNKTQYAIDIHCFEPSTFTFAKLNETAKLCNAPHIHITLNNCALSNTQGNATLYYDTQGSGLASLSKRRLEHFQIDFKESEEIQTMRLSSYCKEREITHIHLLKLDVEGYELNVLESAKTLFEAKAIDMVCFEFGGCNIDTRSFFQDFWYFFKAYNFSLYRILPNSTFLHIKSYKEIYEQFTTTNYLACASEVAMDIGQ